MYLHSTCTWNVFMTLLLLQALVALHLGAMKASGQHEQSPWLLKMHLPFGQALSF